MAHRKDYVDSHVISTSNHTHSKTLTQPAKSPGSSPKADKKLQALTPNSSPPRAKRQAPPPPADSSKKSPQSKSSNSYSETNQVIRREKWAEINALKDNRYSLQVDPNNIDQYRPRFGSLPRRSAPAPPNRRDSISNSTSSGPSATGKPPLHPSVQGGGLKEANLTGVSTFSPSTSSPSKHIITNTSPQGRRYSTDVASTSPQKVSPGTHRRYSDDVSPPRRAYTLSGPRTSDSARGNRRRTESNSSGSPRYSRSRSSSKENETLLFQSQTQPPKIELPTTFTRTDGSELLESVRSRTGISYRKTLVAVSGVLEFLKNKVPVCAEMVDGLVTAAQESQVS